MSSKLWFLIFALLLTACSTLHKQALETKASSEETRKWSAEKQLEKDWKTLKRDSLATDVEMEVWPKGILKITPDGGFEGELLKLKVKKHKVQLQKTNQQGMERRSSRTDSVLQKHETAVSKAELKDRDAKPIGWICAIAFLIAGLLATIGLIRKKVR